MLCAFALELVLNDSVLGLEVADFHLFFGCEYGVADVLM
ncbi:hypothetical protein OCH239_09915 [Roseivivax halodurans JCM 10272]|uniref:Uncharacterized protein n=1 Tax=Roseivivax halodurans JCM 10272 TaxID=1449350 RepID=X7EC36_9RHOB|nr:hypothetical protein OCH239_09915 [Roseivivax halodurans JCM 10272]